MFVSKVQMTKVLHIVPCCMLVQEICQLALSSYVLGKYLRRQQLQCQIMYVFQGVWFGRDHTQSCSNSQLACYFALSCAYWHPLGHQAWMYKGMPCFRTASMSDVYSWCTLTRLYRCNELWIVPSFAVRYWGLAMLVACCLRACFYHACYSI